MEMGVLKIRSLIQYRMPVKIRNYVAIDFFVLKPMKRGTEICKKYLASLGFILGFSFLSSTFFGPYFMKIVLPISLGPAALLLHNLDSWTVYPLMLAPLIFSFYISKMKILGAIFLSLAWAAIGLLIVFQKMIYNLST